MSSRRVWFVSLSIAGHLGIGFAIYASNTWGLEKLGPGKGPAVALGVLSPHAPAGESPSPKETVKNNPKRTRVTATVQLEKIVARPDEAPGAGSGTGSGAGSGEGSGSGETPAIGGCTLPPCGEPPKIPEQPEIEVPKPAAPKRVDPRHLAAIRIAGRDDIQPPERVKRTMVDDGRLRSTGTFEVCIDQAGLVSAVRVLVSTRYPDYDSRLASAIRGWRYKPQVTAGQPVSVCSTVTFIYTIK